MSEGTRYTTLRWGVTSEGSIFSVRLCSMLDVCERWALRAHPLSGRSLCLKRTVRFLGFSWSSVGWMRLAGWGLGYFTMRSNILLLHACVAGMCR